MADPYRLLCEKLKDLGDLDEGRRDVGGVLSSAVDAVREILDAPLVVAALQTDSVRVAAVSEAGNAPRMEPWGEAGRLSHLVIQMRERRSWMAGEEPTPSNADFLGRGPREAWMAVPLPLADRPSGILAVALGERRPFEAWERELLDLVAGYTAVALGNLRTFQEVESLSVTDDLTRVYNYRFMKAALRREVERASRYGQVFSILMLDVDHLKDFNEKHGHLEGSDLLRRLAGILSRSSRAIDLVAKYGGDEFLLILPQTNTEGAVVMGRRICSAVEETAFSYCRPGDITVSVGVATFPQHGESMETLLAASDAALFDAKRNGRNCVLTAHRPAQHDRVSKAA